MIGLLVCRGVGTGFAGAQDAVVLRDERGDYRLGRHLALLEDRDRAWTIDDVTAERLQERFEASTRSVPQLGYTTSAYWVRFTLRDAAAPGTSWLLEVASKSLDDVTFYAPTASGFAEKRVGDAFPYDRRDVRHRNFVFRLHGLDATAQTFYLRVVSNGPIHLPMTVWTPEALARKDRVANFFLGGFFGILLVMGIYNLLLYVTIRDASFLYYVLYIASYLAYQLTVERIAFAYVWPDNLWWSDRSYTTLGLLTAVCGLQFTRVFLHTPRYVPRLDTVLKGFMGACGGLVVLNLFVRHPAVNVVAVTFFIALVFVILAVAVQCLRQGDRVALYYLLAWTFLLTGLLVSMVTMLGLLPYAVAGIRYVQIGSAFEVTLLSLGLGYRYRALEVEREQMRLRIASDLHDDIGSGLTQISLYSELIERATDGQAADWANRMGTLARSLAGEMQDIVWSIQPRQESWDALALRMKDYATGLLATRDIALVMQGTQEHQHTYLPPFVRQNVLLMFKEIVHNAVRHAGCSVLTVDWRLTGQALRLRIRDDGCGFDPGRVVRGNGLNNLRHRAEAMGASLTLRSAPGESTCIEIEVPL